MAAAFCMQGVSGVGVAVPSSSALVRLWAHEAMRVFHDRLVSTEDRSWFCGALQQAVDKHWPQASFSQVFPPKEGQQAQVRAADIPVSCNQQLCGTKCLLGSLLACRNTLECHTLGTETL